MREKGTGTVGVAGGTGRARPRHRKVMALVENRRGYLEMLAPAPLCIGLLFALAWGMELEFLAGPLLFCAPFVTLYVLGVARFFRKRYTLCPVRMWGYGLACVLVTASLPMLVLAVGLRTPPAEDAGLGFTDVERFERGMQWALLVLAGKAAMLALVAAVVGLVCITLWYREIER